MSVIQVLPISDEFMMLRSRKTEEMLTGIPQGTTVIVDGLAVVELWDMFEKFLDKLKIIPLIHYPTSTEIEASEDIRKVSAAVLDNLMGASNARNSL